METKKWYASKMQYTLYYPIAHNPGSLHNKNKTSYSIQ